MARRRSPFDEFERLFDRMSTQFEDIEGGLAVDVEDAGDSFVVTADLPGFEKEDIDLTLRDDALAIEAEHEEEAGGEEERYVRRERSKRSMKRSVSLPESVDEEGVSASFKNGVLTVTLPKAGVAESGTSIDIE